MSLADRKRLLVGKAMKYTYTWSLGRIDLTILSIRIVSRFLPTAPWAYYLQAQRITRDVSDLHVIAWRPKGRVDDEVYENHAAKRRERCREAVTNEKMVKYV